MEILIKRHATFTQALTTLDEILKELDQASPRYKIIFRDSCIQRFEYSADIFWKLLKDYLTLALGVSIEEPSPKKVFKEAVTAKVITIKEKASCDTLIEDRNSTSHTYNEELAQEICSRINQHYNLMKLLADRIEPSVRKYL